MRGDSRRAYLRASAGQDHHLVYVRGDVGMESFAFDRQVDRSPAPAVAGRPRVLVVEDNPDMNRFVTQCLERHYEVVSAFDGREGLERALQFRPCSWCPTS